MNLTMSMVPTLTFIFDSQHASVIVASHAATTRRDRGDQDFAEARLASVEEAAYSLDAR
jgi:hypothetical protein